MSKDKRHVFQQDSQQLKKMTLFPLPEFEKSPGIPYAVPTVATYATVHSARLPSTVTVKKC